MQYLQLGHIQLHTCSNSLVSVDTLCPRGSSTNVLDPQSNHLASVTHARTVRYQSPQPTESVLSDTERFWNRHLEYHRHKKEVVIYDGAHKLRR